ncbi:MAG: hypothetical protein LUP97_05135 [Methanoregula sp.]|nr:hypothetical protein [Methanoregula sp.]
MGSQHPFCFPVIELSHLGNINNGFNESAGRAFGGNRASAEKIALFKDKIRGDNVLLLHHLVQISLALSYHVIQRGLLDLGHMMVDHDIGHRVPQESVDILVKMMGEEEEDLDELFYRTLVFLFRLVL